MGRSIMNRDEILAMVTRYIAETAEEPITPALDPAKSMKDYGLSSLDMVEVISRSMRSLKVTVPRSELRGIRTIDGLVDLLHRAVAARAVD